VVVLYFSDGLLLASLWPIIGADEGELRSCQIGRHHKFVVARFDEAVAIEHLNRSATARYIFNQPGVISAVPGIAFGLKGAAYSVAIPEYGVVHDDLLQKATSSI
jgi:hypothetical protein